jgi:hypothetical protein
MVIFKKRTKFLRDARIQKFESLFDNSPTQSPQLTPKVSQIKLEREID